jgi:AcrR family transcriptional regulator
MATTCSQPVGDAGDRRSRRRLATIDEALDHAVDVMTEQGVGALSVSEVARRLGMRAPSLYKYFPAGLHELYDALFARAVQSAVAHASAAAGTLPPGVARLRAFGRGYVRWAVENPALAQLQHWRVVPGFAPSAEVMALSSRSMHTALTELNAAVDAGELRPEATAEDALASWTVLLSGLMTQQMANQPGASFADGRFTRLTDPVFDLWFDRYSTHPRRT